MEGPDQFHIRAVSWPGTTWSKRHGHFESGLAVRACTPARAAVAARKTRPVIPAERARRFPREPRARAASAARGQAPIASRARAGGNGDQLRHHQNTLDCFAPLRELSAHRLFGSSALRRHFRDRAPEHPSGELAGGSQGARTSVTTSKMDSSGSAPAARNISTPAGVPAPRIASRAPWLAHQV